MTKRKTNLGEASESAAAVTTSIFAICGMIAGTLIPIDFVRLGDPGDVLASAILYGGFMLLLRLVWSLTQT